MNLESPCIETTGTRRPDGYGVTQVTIGKGSRVVIYAHRLAFERAWGIPIPPGMVVRHTCDNPPCVNPLHLQLGTHADNNRDQVERGRHGREGATHCCSGLHEWAPENIYTSPSGVSQCRPCHRERQRERLARQRAS